MSEILEKVKISELQLVSSYVNLFTLGTDGQNRSVKVPLDVLAKIGDTANLTTTVTTDLVAAINSLVTAIGTFNTAIGALTSLNTEEKSNLVGAINEVLQSIDDKFVFMTEEQFAALTTYDSTKIYCTYEG